MSYAISYKFSSVPPIPTFTEGGREVWNKSVRLAKKHPRSSVTDIIKKALDISGVSAIELSPEDMRSIEMGLEAVLTQRQIFLGPANSTVQPNSVEVNPADQSSGAGFFVR